MVHRARADERAQLGDARANGCAVRQMGLLADARADDVHHVDVGERGRLAHGCAHVRDTRSRAAKHLSP